MEGNQIMSYEDEKSPECDAEHLIAAEEIKADKARFAAAKVILDKKSEAIKSISGMRKKAEELSREEGGLAPVINIDLKMKESLMTEEDKAQIQADNEWKKGQAKLGIKKAARE